MKAILGLGNPGLRFRFSRHNLGFLVVDELAKANSIKIKQRAFASVLGKGVIGNQKVLLAKPLTFMNLSGTSAAQIVRQKRIKLKDLLVVLDDVNLPLGKVRIRPEGSEGGHKGLRSIIESLGSCAFARLRIGVGLPRLCPQKLGKLSRHVLGRFNKKEIKIIIAAVEEAKSACEVWATDGITKAMNGFN